MALNELKYIAHLRQGGRTAPPQAVPGKIGANVDKRTLCGPKVTTSGKVGNIDGRTVLICEACLKKHQKKWWEFWK